MPKSFKKIDVGGTDVHECNKPATISIIPVREGTGHLIILNQKLEKDRSYGFNNHQLFQKVYNSDEAEQVVSYWTFGESKCEYDCKETEQE